MYTYVIIDDESLIRKGTIKKLSLMQDMIQCVGEAENGEDGIKLVEQLHPDLVFAPSLHDIHQDHATVASEALRAFKKTSILGYEEPWNNLTFNNQVFVTLQEHHVRAKAKAFACYESQRGRPYADEGFFLSLAHCHGIQIGRDYAEVFETVRWIL